MEEKLVLVWGWWLCEESYLEYLAGQKESEKDLQYNLFEEDK